VNEHLGIDDYPAPPNDPEKNPRAASGRPLMTPLASIPPSDRHRAGDLCGDTGAQAVAEGIETASELETVRELGITYGQGISSAAPARLAVETLEAAIDAALTPVPRLARQRSQAWGLDW
jgi:hypothetical protein